MKVAAAQISVIPGEIESNTTKMLSYISAARERQADVVVFPEMSDTGYDLPLVVQTAQSWNTGTVPKLKKAAQDNKLNIVAGLSERTTNGIYNTTIIIDRTGNIAGRYRKTHLCTVKPIQEHLFLKAGEKLETLKIDGIQCGFITCYEIRFPEITRSLSLHGTKIIFIVSAFPMVRIQHWLTLINARAIENQVFVVASSRVGVDAGMTLCGSTSIIDPYGTSIAAGSAIHEGLIVGDIDLELLDTVRSQIQVHQDRRPDLYIS